MSHIAIGMKLREGPWGGGNQFGRALARDLFGRGARVSHDLNAPDLDLIVLTDPRRELESVAFTDHEIWRYLARRNRRALVVHRINECDERKGTRGMNARLLRANLCADHTVFVASWLRDLFVARGLPCRSTSVILNGSDASIFNSEGCQRWDGQAPLRIVTHHWGGHWLKGFDIYQRLDEMIGAPPYQGRLAFTYIGNLPQGFSFRNASHIPPTSGRDLAALLRQHHVYLTASQFEPGGHHQNEGALCGLPLLYRESGCMPEYCGGFGVCFTPDDFEEKLCEMMRTYAYWAARMKDYPHTAERMCSEYHALFEHLLSRREEILRARRPWRRLRWLWAGVCAR